MSVYTTYDFKRDELRDKLNECLRQAKELLMGEDIWGYEDMKEGYAEELYLLVKKARDSV